MKLIQNSKGTRFFGLHFYSGVAQYQDDPSQEPYRVFLNEDTLRRMDQSFQGCPIFVEHVDEVDPDLDQLRKEVDGWVLKSFYNETDGKHWVEFIICSERAEKAIKNGMRLSNAYIPKKFASGGLWNGVPYAKEITDAEYEHLAIVQNPRYEESVILTPEQFTKYNSDQIIELKRVANSKGDQKMKFTFFKKSKVENAIDPDLQLVLPKSGRSISLQKLINDAYEKDQDGAMDSNPMNDESSKSHSMANMDHMCKMHDGSYMKVKDVLSKHQAMCDEMDEMKKTKKDSPNKELDLKVEEDPVDSEGDLHNVEHEEEVDQAEKKEEMHDDMEMDPEKPVHDESEDDMPMQKKSKLKIEDEDDDQKEVKDAKKNIKKNEINQAAARVKAERLRNAHLKVFENEEAEHLELNFERVQRGKARYGS